MQGKTKILIVVCLVIVAGAGTLYFFLRPADSDRVLATPEEPGASLEGVDILTIAAHIDELRSWLRKVGPKRVMAQLLENSGGGSLEDCHQEAHAVGRVAYDLYGPTAFRDGSSQCHAGYYHGAMESLLHKEGTGDLTKTIRNICTLFTTQHETFECLHGVGHGVMAYENYDLPQALRNCEELDSDNSRNACYGGVFMENVVTAQGIGARKDHTTPWVSGDPHFPCNAVSKSIPVQEQCYLVQTTWMLELLDSNFGKVTAECLQAPREVVGLCFASMGKDAAGRSLRDPRQIAAVCANAPKENEYYNYCIAGGLNVIVDFWGSELKDQATDLCKIVPTAHKLRCYTVLADRFPGIFSSPADRQAVCAGFEKEYQNLCSGSQGVLRPAV